MSITGSVTQGPDHDLVEWRLASGHRQKKKIQNRARPMAARLKNKTNNPRVQQAVNNREFRITECEERKSDNLVCFAYSLSLSENIEVQHRYICFGSFSISELQVTVPVHKP